MKTAFLFPGQGSQKTELLHNLPKCNEVEKILETASQILNEDVYNFHTNEALSSTRSVQISLFVSGVASFKVFAAEGIMPDFVAGHSIGAFGAAVAAGVIEFSDALKMVMLRGELMEKAYPEAYGMGVVLGMDLHKLQALIAKHQEHSVYLANQNALDQFTISGPLLGIQSVLDDAKEQGARCAKMLNVSTPSHCPLLDSVSAALSDALQKHEFRSPVIPYVGNRKARLLFHPDDIRKDLAESVSAAVLWHDATTVLYESGARLFIEMPPGNVLSRLAEKAFPDAIVLSVSENGFDDCQYVAAREQLKR